MTSLPVSIKFIDSLIYSDDSTTNYVGKNIDAIIILSGMLKVVKNNNKNYYEWGEASDRFFHGMTLAKKFPNLPIIFTSGLLPWSNIAMSEGEFLANFAIENFNFGVRRKDSAELLCVRCSGTEGRSFLPSKRRTTHS